MKAKAKAKRSGLRKFRRWAVLVAFFAVLLPWGTVFVTRVGALGERLKGLVIGVIRKELGWEAQMGGVSVQLFPFELVLSQVKIDDPNYGPLAQVQAIKVKPALPPLLRGRLEIDTITIESPRLWLIVGEEGIRNWPRIEGGGGGGGPTLPFRRLAIHHGGLEIDGSDWFKASVDGIEAEVKAELKSRVGIFIQAQGRVERAGQAHIVSKLFLSAHIAQDGVEVDAFALDLPWAKVELEEVAFSLPPPRIEEIAQHLKGAFQVAFDFGVLPSLALPLHLPRIEGKLELQGRIDEGQLEAHLSSKSPGLSNLGWVIGYSSNSTQE
ncbi:MAG: AsmA family protein [Sandaracinaceae bacterium]|nr:AsmA family protein [Sandaracinaceae bacterium]